MKVGEVVKRSGASRKALRLYEARGILPPPRRSASGYRVYADEVLSLLNFVQQCRRLGLTLAEIKHIIGLRRSGAAPCAHVRRLLVQKGSRPEGASNRGPRHPQSVGPSPMDSTPPSVRTSTHRGSAIPRVSLPGALTPIVANSA